MSNHFYNHRDICPRCGNLQANVNNPGFQALLRLDQLRRHHCLNCGWHLGVQPDSEVGGDEGDEHVEDDRDNRLVPDDSVERPWSRQDWFRWHLLVG